MSSGSHYGLISYRGAPRCVHCMVDINILYSVKLIQVSYLLLPRILLARTAGENGYMKMTLQFSATKDYIDTKGICRGG